MLNRLIFVGALSLLWILLGSWYVGTYMAPSELTIAALNVADDEMQFQSEDHFSFDAGSDIIEVGESTKSMMNEISAYLHAHPNRMVTLIGQYIEGELNDTEYENLGLARADAMRKYLQDIGLPAPQMETDFELVAGNPLQSGKFYDAVSFKFKPIFTIDPSEFPDEDAPMAAEEVEPMLVFGEAIGQLELNPSIMHFIEKIKSFQIEHPHRKIQIIGHAEHSDNVNRAITRSKSNAAQVKRFLMKNGIRSGGIVMESKGASEPMVGPRNEMASEKNNRVEISILPE